MIDHVDYACVAGRKAALTRRAAQRIDQMRLSSPRRSNEQRTTVAPDEVAIKEPQDRGLGDPLGDVELALGEGLSLRQPCPPESPFEGALLARRLLDAKSVSGRQEQNSFCEPLHPGLRGSPGRSERREALSQLRDLNELPLAGLVHYKRVLQWCHH
jgi:hypothetical protein